MSGSSVYSRTIRLIISDRIKNYITVIPNPINDWAQLNINSVTNSLADIYVYNINGEKIYSKHVSVQQGGNNFDLSEVLDWPRGVYQMRVQLRNEIFFKKIIVAR
jgi:predicted helicase